jgi:ATP/maltotriose-dependent transcriptional regulator MalT
MQRDFEQAASLYADAVTGFDAIGDESMAGTYRSCLGLAVLQLGARARASQLVHEGVQAAVKLQDRWALTLGVNVTSLFAGDTAEPEQRARLLGAGDALRGAMGFRTTGWERMSGQNVASLREQLEHEGGEAAYRQGQSLPFADVGTLTLTMLDNFSRALDHNGSAEQHPPQGIILTDRELEVLGLVAEGLSSKVIGKQLFISVSTVNYHLTSIFNKLGVDTRAQAVAVAAQRGILLPDSSF